MWQTCPVCKGSGVVSTPDFKTEKVCEVCKGKKIISQSNGLPPENHKVNESTQQKNLLLS